MISLEKTPKNEPEESEWSILCKTHPFLQPHLQIISCASWQPVGMKAHKEKKKN